MEFTPPRAIRAHLAALGVSQHALARALGVSQATLSLWLNGYRRPPAGFEAAAHAELDVMERADRAAAELRAQVLAEGRAGRAGEWCARARRARNGPASGRR